MNTHKKPISFYLLVIFLFAIPTTEALKNISMFLLVLFSLYEIQWNKEKLSIDFYDLIAILFFWGHIFSTFMSELKVDEWRGLGDILKFSILFFIFRRLDYLKIFRWLFLDIIIFSTSFASLISLYIFHHAGDSQEVLKLMSVGGANISGVFLSIVFIISLIRISNRKQLQKTWLIFHIINILAIGFALLATKSSAAVAITIALLILFSILTIKEKNNKSTYLSFTLVATIIVSSITFFPDLIQSKLNQVNSNSFLAPRIAIWKTHLHLISINPLFGLGKNNYTQYDSNDLKEIVNKKPLITEPKYQYFFTGKNTHAHSLYLQALTDYGILGLSLLIIQFFIIIYYSLKGNSKTDYKLLFSTIIILVCGITTPSFHHEVLLLLAFLYSLSNPCKIERT